MSSELSTPLAPRLIDSPGQLLAAIPTILGYNPTEAVVLVSLKEPERGAPSPAKIIGPVLRVAIDHALDHLPALMERYRRIHEGQVVAVLISHHEPAELAEIISTLEEAENYFPLRISFIFYVKAIRSGQRYWGLLGSARHELNHGTVAAPGGVQAWELGTVTGPIPPAPPGEHELLNPAMDAVTREELERAATSYGHDLALTILTGSYPQAASNCQLSSDDGDLEILRLADQVVSAVPQAQTLSAAQQNNALLESWASWLTQPIVRDIITAPILDRPAPSHIVLLAVIQTFSGTIRANALSLYAMCALALGDSHTARSALHYCTEHYPEHKLGNLLLQLLAAGHEHDAVAACRAGSLEARQCISDGI